MTLDEARLDLSAGLGLLLDDPGLQSRLYVAMRFYESGQIVEDDLEHVTALAVGRLVAQLHPHANWLAERWKRHFIAGDSSVPVLEDVFSN